MASSEMLELLIEWAPCVLFERSSAGDACGMGPPGSRGCAIFAPHILQKRAPSKLRSPHDWQNTMGAWYVMSAHPVTRLFVFASFTALLVQGALCHADSGDTVYQRLDGDLTLSAGIGGGLALFDRVGPDVTGTTVLELRARILDSGGLLVSPEWRPEGDSRLIVAFDLRPLFLMRFFANLESGDRVLDLFIDSIGLDLGVAVGPLSHEVGLATAVGLGFDIPLYIPSGVHGGLFLRVSTRYVGAGPTDQLAPRGGTDDLAMLFVLTVRGITNLGIARWEGARYETPPAP